MAKQNAIEFTNFFAGGDERREELLAEPACTCDCGCDCNSACYPCSCECVCGTDCYTQCRGSGNYATGLATQKPITNVQNTADTANTTYSTQKQRVDDRLHSDPYRGNRGG
jgi:hypothetical protein